MIGFSAVLHVYPRHAIARLRNRYGLSVPRTRPSTRAHVALCSDRMGGVAVEEMPRTGLVPPRNHTSGAAQRSSWVPPRERPGLGGLRSDDQRERRLELCGTPLTAHCDGGVIGSGVEVRRGYASCTGPLMTRLKHVVRRDLALPGGGVNCPRPPRSVAFSRTLSGNGLLDAVRTTSRHARCCPII
jgi:hypothetical protein